MKTILHKAETRIVNDLGWLRIHASFREDSSIEDRRQFGFLLIVDDALMIPGGRGFKLHPHQNMEIISWVISGVDEHHDSEHGIRLISGGNVQLMSAGTGIEHAENNCSETEPVHMFQIWIAPKAIDVSPRYQTKSLHGMDRTNKLLTFISPDGSNDSLIINQDAYLSLTTMEKGKGLTYKMHNVKNGVYILVLFGKIDAAGTVLCNRDALGIETKGAIEIASMEKSEVLFIEVPIS